MAYQGISPDLYRNNLTNVQLLDDISGSFNGTTTQFNLTVNGSAFHAVSARSLFIVLGGIVQEPDQDYTVSGGVITFTTAPNAGLTFSGRNIYGLNQLTGVNDGLVTPAKLSLGGPSWNTDGDLILSGDTNNVYVNTDTPTVRPTLDLNFERDRRLDSRITYSRSSTATYLGSDGLIKTALVNEPRFEYDRNGNSLGFLIEEGRTNLITYSEDYTQWTTDAATTTANVVSAPDGLTTADSFVPTTSNAVHRIYRVLTVNNATVYTFSYFVKPFGYTKVFLRIGGQSSSPVVVWNTATKTVDSTAGIFTSSFIEEYPNGWYRVGLTMTTNITTYAPNIGAVSDTYTFASATNEVTFAGNGTSGAYVWGAQLELGAFATSYIPTVASTVTRSVDIATINGTNFTSWYNPSESTVYGAGRSITGSSDTDANPAMVSIDDNTLNNRFILRRLDGQSYANPLYSGFTFRYVRTGQINLDVFPPVVQSTGILPQWTDTNLHKMAFAISTTAQVAYGDGINALITNQVSLTPWTAATQMQIGAGASSAYWNGHISRIIYYPKRLTNNQLSNLTS